MGLTNTEPSGALRFAASSTFAQLYVMPLIPGSLQRYPGINLNMRLSDIQFDLISGSVDLALRNIELKDSSLRARKLADDHRVICASPDYLQQFGASQKPDDLVGHQLIGFQDQSPERLVGMDGFEGLFDLQ